MKITLVSGSHRENSESLRVAKYLQAELNISGKVQAEIISLSKNPLPLWSEEMFGNGEHEKNWKPLAKQLSESEAFVIITPEWGGMVPAGLKNFLLHCSSNEMGHKPALIVSVTAGISGSYPVSELRSSGYKNNRICYIPDHLIIRSVGEMLHGAEAASTRDADIRAHISYSLKVLCEYGKAMRAVRESGVIDYKTYPYGM